MTATAERPTTYTFDPVLFSDVENAFLHAHVGESPAVAFNGGVPSGVNRAAVKPMLELFYDLAQIEAVRGEAWVGVAAVRAAIETYQREQAKWREMRKRGAPANPSMYAWDNFGKAHRAGVGSDAGRVHTYIDDQGERHRFALDLKQVGDGVYGSFTAPWVKTVSPKDVPTKLIEDAEAGVVTCPVCKHTETYDTSSSSAKRMALLRMSKHLKTAKKEADLHRMVGTNVFGG